MKTFLKLFAAVFVFGFASANASLTADQKAAAIKAVTDAIATGDATQIAAAVSEQVAKYPELAGDIVQAGLQVTGVTSENQTLIVRVAAWTAPNNLSDIKSGIGKSGLPIKTIKSLMAVAVRVAAAAKDAGKARDVMPPITAS